jgi:hypothetical protein
LFLSKNLRAVHEERHGVSFGGVPVRGYHPLAR